MIAERDASFGLDHIHADVGGREERKERNDAEINDERFSHNQIGCDVSDHSWNVMRID
jgi:hypothetical protein